MLKFSGYSISNLIEKGLFLQSDFIFMFKHELIKIRLVYI